ncbi:unnamed protein product [Lymnaea stagnalis]|uniref:C-type lectin domain-containing protein n=1 Tax=Lymnaea stagnalis TaxID=6523 RepID=A0AAV2HGA1_LYMST
MDAISFHQDRPGLKSTGDYNRLSSSSSSKQISPSETDANGEHIYALSDRIRNSSQAIASLAVSNRPNNDKNTRPSMLEDNPPGKNNTMVCSQPLPPVVLQNNAPSMLTPVQIPLYYNYLNESSTDESITNSKEKRIRPSEDRELPGIPNSTVRTRNNALTSGDPRNRGSSRNQLISTSNKAPMEVESQKANNLSVSYRHCFAAVFIFALVALAIVGSTLGGVILVGFRIQDRIQGTFSEASDKMAAMLEDSHANLTRKVGALCSANQDVSDVRVLFSDSCYCLYWRKLSWFDAREFCLELGNGVHLAEIYDTRTNDILLPIFQHSPVNDGIWLGGSDLVETGKWVWNYTGRALETFSPTSQWEPGEPSNFSHLNYPEHCLYLYKWRVPNFMWNDHVCTDVKPFVCKSSHENSKCHC